MASSGFEAQLSTVKGGGGEATTGAPGAGPGGGEGGAQVKLRVSAPEAVQ